MSQSVHERNGMRYEIEKYHQKRFEIAQTFIFNIEIKKNSLHLLFSYYLICYSNFCFLF